MNTNILAKLHKDGKDWEYRVRVKAVKVALEVVSLKIVQFSLLIICPSVIRHMIVLTRHHIISSACKPGLPLWSGTYLVTE